MIEFHYKIDWALEQESKFADWLSRVIERDGFVVGHLDYIFCDDDFLYEINKEHLNHEYYTDIITFDYTEGDTISGDIFISLDRVKENSKSYGNGFEGELLRVMSHGVLHLMGHKDKSQDESEKMRLLEDERIKLFHVER